MTLASTPFAIFEAPALQALVVGIAVGAAVGRLMVRYRESRDGAELPAVSIRRIEAGWVVFGSVAALLVQAYTELS